MFANLTTSTAHLSDRRTYFLFLPPTSPRFPSASVISTPLCKCNFDSSATNPLTIFPLVPFWAPRQAMESFVPAAGMIKPETGCTALLQADDQQQVTGLAPKTMVATSLPQPQPQVSTPLQPPVTSLQQQQQPPQPTPVMAQAPPQPPVSVTVSAPPPQPPPASAPQPQPQVTAPQPQVSAPQPQTLQVSAAQPPQVTAQPSQVSAPQALQVTTPQPSISAPQVSAPQVSAPLPCEAAPSTVAIAVRHKEEPVTPTRETNVVSRSCGSQRNAAWAYRVYQEWASSRNSSMHGSPRAPVDLATTNLAEIDFWLQRFVVEVRDKAGEPYRPATLYRLCCNFQRHLREVHGRWDVDLFRRKENTFAGFRQALDNEMKRLSETPRWPSTVKSESSMLPPPTMAPMQSALAPIKDLMEPVALDDDATESARLWASFDLTTSTGLAHCMYYGISRIFGLRSREEHRRLEVSDFTFGMDDRGHYVILRRRSNEPPQPPQPAQPSQVTTGPDGMLTEPSQPPPPPPQPTYQYLRHYANPGDPRDFVGLLRRYLSLVPSEGPFYRRPVYTPAGVPVRFSTQVVGVNTFSKWHKEMRERAGLDAWARLPPPTQHLRTNLNHSEGASAAGEFEFRVDAQGRKRPHRTIRVSPSFRC